MLCNHEVMLESCRLYQGAGTAHPMHLTPKSALVSFIEKIMTHNSFHFTSFTTSINSCSNGTSLETMVIFKLMKQGDW